jgi:hypothetical protein
MGLPGFYRHSASGAGRMQYTFLALASLRPSLIRSARLQPIPSSPSVLCFAMVVDKGRKKASE